ncbi:MAG: hypothetical protein IOB81_18895, partial [Burkholderia sp.]|nr:hypothetical protein [Burkholderia sp.]
MLFFMRGCGLFTRIIACSRKCRARVGEQADRTLAASADRTSGRTDARFPFVHPLTLPMMKLAKLTACIVILAATSITAAHARDLDKSDSDRAQILAAVHLLNDREPDLKDYRYVVVDLVKDRDVAFACVALADKDGSVEMTEDQAEIMTFALERRDSRW